MSSEVSKLIIEHVKHRPAALPQDIYKLLYQGVFGVGHILSDKAWDVLVEEAERIDINEHIDDPLFEPVSPDGSIVRVNLRQYIKLGGDLKTLFRVMRESGKIKGNSARFLEYWSLFKELVREGTLSFNFEDIRILDDMILRKGVIPRHHSESYRDAYYPAYRVVSMEVYMESNGISG